MPISVTVPTKIRIDRKALVDHPEWIEDALAATLGRALANSKKTVLEPRGDYLGVSIHPPAFTWSGLSVEAHERVKLEQLVADAIREIIAAQGIGVSLTRPDVPEVMPDNPSELFDPLRGYPLLGVYTVDSYKGGTDDIQVVDEQHPLLLDYVPVVRVFPETMTEEVRFALVDLSARATPEHPLGVVYRFLNGGQVQWHVLVTDGAKDNPDPESPIIANLVGAFVFEGFFGFQFMGENASPMFKRVPYTPPPGPGTAEIFDVPADEDGVKKKFKELMGQGLVDTLLRHSRKPISMTTKKFEETIEKRVDDQIDLAVANRKAVSKVIKVTLGSSAVMIWMTKADEEYLKWTGRATLTPLETIVARPKPKKTGGGSSGGGGPQKGPGTKGVGGGGTGGGDCPPDDQERDPLKELFGDDGPTMECRALRGEPELEEIGDAGELLGKHITAIATKLGISECKYPGQFCYHAASYLNEKALATHTMAETATGENKATHAEKGNMGPVDFEPGASPVIAAIRDLAGAVPLISQFMAATVDVFSSDTYRCSIHGTWRGKGLSWALRFLEDVVPVLRTAIGNLFIGACRSMLLQLLATSLDQINKRLTSMDRYAPLFERWILPQITDIAELEKLHTILRDYKYAKIAQQVVTGVPTASAQEWNVATGRLVSSLLGGAIVRQAGQAYEIVTTAGIDKVRDTKGVLWTSEDLEQALALRRGLAEGVDPLVKQITDTPDAVKRFKDTDSIRTELETLLKEMARNNAEMSGKADKDPMFAFKASSVNEDIPKATVRGGKYALQGIHKVAHERIYDAFEFDSQYALGLDYLFDSEEGKAAIIGFGIFAGFILLCVLVPGGAFIAFVAGGALAAHALDKAYEKKRLYRSLINPDMVLTHAEVEVAIFVAWFGVVMSAIPEAGTATKGLIAGGRAILKGEAKTIGKMAGRAVAKRVSKELVEYAAKDLLEALIKEAAMNVVIDQVIQKAITPLIQEVQQQSGVGFVSVAGGGEADDSGQADFLDMIRTLETLDDEEGEGEKDQTEVQP
jgi:hypothetical protein